MTSRPRRATAVSREFKQARHYLHPYRENRKQVLRDLAALAGLQVPWFPLRRRVAGTVWAVSLVRDEIDVIDLTLDHLIRQGVHHLLVADNGSRDGTLERLRQRAAADRRIHVAVDREGRFFQDAKVSRLAQVAALAGADWVVPFDADEMWFAPDSRLAEFLAASDANQILAETYNAVRAGNEYLVSSKPTTYRKVAFRAHPLARVEFGNHAVHRVGPRGSGLSIAHLAYRSHEHLRRKLAQGAVAAARNGMGERIGYHWWWGSRLPPPMFEDVWLNVAAGRPDIRIDWRGLVDPYRADIEHWTHWEGPRVDVPV